MKRQRLALFALVLSATLPSFASGVRVDLPSSSEALATGPDPHSWARPDKARVEHLDLDLEVDFASRRLLGRAELTLAEGAGSRLILDTRDLDVTRVRVEGKDARWRLGKPGLTFLGRPLIVELPQSSRKVEVTYSTHPSASALQWLTPAQTLGGEHPFLFTQSQALLARTWVPIQDSPAVRFTYSATVSVPPELTAVMSAGGNPRQRNDEGVYHFEMPQPIPSYLLALAVGELDFRELGDRTGIYAESGIIDAAADEFAETEAMLLAVENLYGPYRWGRYDLLVLPPSFPFGGMENPRLTFLTPTVIAGDRSLVSLIAHELAHSWSGNLVTNATWNDFWLNEGFTVYLERRIMEAVYSRDYSEMLAELGRQDLEQALVELGESSRDTHLRLDLGGRDADEGMTDIAYEKGYLFLRTLEEHVGRKAFDAFLRRYFDAFAFRPTSTDDLVSHLESDLLTSQPKLAPFDLSAWIDAPGIPPGAATVKAKALAQVETELRRFVAGEPASSLAKDNWTTHHWLHFLRLLAPRQPIDRLADLERTFAFSGRNSEIAFAWFLLSIRSGYEPVFAEVEAFLGSVGRTKFVEPLFAALAESPEGRRRALRIYEKTRPGYHPVTAQTVDDLLDWPRPVSSVPSPPEDSGAE